MQCTYIIIVVLSFSVLYIVVLWLYCIVTVMQFVIILIKFYVCMYVCMYVMRQ